MRCETCGAPAVLLANACVFCGTPIGDSHAPAELLDYLAARLPDARVKRFALGRARPVREFKLLVGETEYKARIRRGRLELAPPLPPARWVDSLLTSLSSQAAGDHDLRSRLSRAGWKLR